MEFSCIKDVKDRKASDLLVIPFWKGAKKPEIASKEISQKETLLPIELGDFSGKKGEVAFVYGNFPHEKRIALLGLGEKEKQTVEMLRRSFGQLVKHCKAKKVAEISLLLPEDKSLLRKDIIRGACEGILSMNYQFTELKSSFSKEDLVKPLKKIYLIGGEKGDAALANKYATIAEGVYLARDLVNGNADDVTPQYLGSIAKKLSQEFSSIRADLFDKKRIEKEKMGLLLAVNRGSDKDPFFGVLSYQGNPKSKDHTVIIGKGITYDTGGLNLKPTGSMETMKCDMSGAAAVLGTLYAVAKLKLKVNLTGIIASTENSIGPKSYKPGDVYRSRLGKTVEIGNTDAEGRLVLADALAYACDELKPTRIINFATLTGAMDIVFGNEAAGLFSNNEELAEALIVSSDATSERLWRLPTFEDLREKLNSDIADMRNIGGRSAGSVTAALFLKEFVGKVPWAHCDIASTAFLSEPKRYLPKYGTGIGVRLMVEFLEGLG